MITLTIIVMRNCPSQKLAAHYALWDHAELHSDNSYTSFLAEERLGDIVYRSTDQWVENKLERAHDDINELWEKCPCELGRGYMVE